MKDADLFLLGGLAVIGYVLYKQFNPTINGQGIPEPYNPVTGSPDNTGTPPLPTSFPGNSGASNMSTPGTATNGQTSTNPTGAPTGPNTNPGSDPGDDNYDALSASSVADGYDPASDQGDPGDN